MILHYTDGSNELGFSRWEKLSRIFIPPFSYIFLTATPKSSIVPFEISASFYSLVFNFIFKDNE